MDRDDDETLLMAADFTGVARLAARTSCDGQHLGVQPKGSYVGARPVHAPADAAILRSSVRLET